MREDEGRILASILNHLFKNRPSWAFTAFVSICVLVLGWMLLTAKRGADLAFPIFGLAFIVILVIGRAVGARLRGRQSESEIPEQPPAGEDAGPSTQAAVDSPTPVAVDRADLRLKGAQNVLEPRASVPRRDPVLLGGIGSAAIVIPALCIVGLTATLSTDAWPEGIAVLVVLAECALAPLAAFLGALGGWGAASIRRKRHPGEPVALIALFAGVGIGLLIAGSSYLAFVSACGRDLACL